jgi:hypothetical protein
MSLPVAECVAIEDYFRSGGQSLANLGIDRVGDRYLVDWRDVDTLSPENKQRFQVIREFEGGIEDHMKSKRFFNWTAVWDVNRHLFYRRDHEFDATSISGAEHVAIAEYFRAKASWMIRRVDNCYIAVSSSASPSSTDDQRFEVIQGFAEAIQGHMASNGFPNWAAIAHGYRHIFYRLDVVFNPNLLATEVGL